VVSLLRKQRTRWVVPHAWHFQPSSFCGPSPGALRLLADHPLAVPAGQLAAVALHSSNAHRAPGGLGDAACLFLLECYSCFTAAQAQHKGLLAVQRAPGVTSWVAAAVGSTAQHGWCRSCWWLLITSKHAGACHVLIMVKRFTMLAC
jgi:hypothetical protein